MNKYKISRKKIEKSLIAELNKLGSKGVDTLPFYDIICDFLATKPESDKESKCIQCEDLDYHMKCQECKERIDREPKEELEGFTMDELDRAVEKSIKDGTNPYLKEEELEVEPVKISERDTISCVNAKLINKLNELIKAHNALVKR